VTAPAARFAHVTADFVGVAAEQLRDTSLVAGLLIAAAGAIGFAGIAAPVVRLLPGDAVGGALLLDGGHIALHGLPARELLLLDVLALAPHDPRKVIDVFARRLCPREIHSDVRARG
jgi:S-adenosylmethionine/arginine decarboxylase-like enzyme